MGSCLLAVVTGLRSHHERGGKLFGEIGGRIGPRADKTHETQEREIQEEDEGTDGFDPEGQYEVSDM